MAKDQFSKILFNPTRSCIFLVELLCYVGLVSVLTFPFNVLFAQKINTIQYNVEDGLPSSNIYQVLEDKKGYIWIATDKGLARFNGYTFQNFTIQDGLPSNDVWGIQQDKKGRLWLSTFNHITYYEDNQFHTLPLKDSLALKAPMLQQYWIGEEEVYLLANENGTNYFLEINVADSTQQLLKKNFQYAGYLGYKNNRKWFFNFPTNNLLPYIYYVEDGTSKEIPFVELNQSSTSVVNRKYIKYSKYVYFFTEDAIWQFDYQQFKKIPIESIFGKGTKIEDIFSKNGTLQNIILLKTNKGYKLLNADLRVLPLLNGTTNFYKSILEDSKGNIWLSATNGLFLITANARNSQYFSLSNNNLNNNCTALYVEEDGTIWAANQKNVLWKIQQDSIEQVQLVQKNYTNVPLKYLLPWENHLVAAGDFGIFLLPPNPFQHTVIEAQPYKKRSSKIYSPHSSKDNFLPIPVKELKIHQKQLIASRSNGVYKFALQQDTLQRVSFIKGRTYSCEVDHDGISWLGRKNGLWRAKGDTIEYLGDKYPLLKYPINDLKIDKDNNIWIATDGFGVLYFDHEKIYSLKESQNSNSNQLFINEQNIVWVATNRGVSKIKFTPAPSAFSYEYLQITSAHGLISNEVNQVVARNNILYAATNAGLTIINTDKAMNNSPPQLYFERITANGKTLPMATHFESAYPATNIAIEYVCLSYKSKSKIEYQYQMTGIDTAWQTTTSLIREYPQLDAGKYTFTIRAKDIDGYYSDTKNIQITIHPSWWATTWFRGVALLLTGIIIYGVFRWQIASIRRQETEKTRINKQMAELELQVLRARMNPHFIFNSMNAIQNYVYTEDKRAAGKYIVQFSRLMRLFLNASYEKFTTLNQEIEISERYVALEKMRFENKFDYEFIIEKTLPLTTIKIPSLILQPYVENAINHGLVHRTTKGYLWVRVYQDNNNMLICEVEDNGIGRVAAQKIRQQSLKKHRPRGMALVAERKRVLNDRHNLEVQIDLIDLYNEQAKATGTKVVIQIPIK